MSTEQNKSPKRWTISEIKAENEAAAGRFFSKENMKFHGDKMANFSVYHREGKVLVQRTKRSKPNVPFTIWEFDPGSGRMLSVS